MDVTATDFRREPVTLSTAAAPVDFQKIVGSLRRHLRLFLAVMLSVVAVIALVTLTSQARYTADATVLINQRASDVLHLNTVTPSDGLVAPQTNDSSAVDTQVEILQSRSLAERVTRQLHLDQDPEFNAALRPPGRFAALKQLFHAQPADNDPAVAKQREYEAVVDTVLRDLSVKRIPMTYTIDLKFTCSDPVKAANIANAFAQRYLTEGLDAKIDETTNATSWLNTRLSQLRGQVQAADAAVAEYRISHGLLSAEGATLTEQEISNVDTQLATAKAQQAEQDARLKTAQDQLAAGSNGGDIGEALASPVVQSLRTQRAQASAQLADLESRYGNKYPDVIKEKQALADLDAQIQVEISRVISNLKAQSEVSHTRTASLAATAASTRGSLAGNNEAQIRLQQLQRDDDAARSIYDGLLSRYKEVTAKEGTQESDARIVSTAKLPTSPSSPNRKLDLVIAVMLGLVAGSAAVLLAELMERGLSNGADVEDALSLPEMGELPLLASTLEGAPGRRGTRDPMAYVVSKPLSRFAEAFRNLRTSLLTSRTGHPVKVVAITSSLPGEGKTTSAVCLARTMSLAGTSVVIVDCDLRQRSLNQAIKVEPHVGLLEVLNGAATLNEALIKDPETTAMVLPLTQSAFTPKDVFGSDAMRELLDQLRSRFDIVLLDTAPVLAVADTRVLCPLADVTLFLTRWRRTSRNAARSALRLLASSEAYVAGVALTQVNVKEQARAGDGASHYYRAYRKYYVG